MHSYYIFDQIFMNFSDQFSHELSDAFLNKVAWALPVSSLLESTFQNFGMLKNFLDFWKINDF